MAPSTLSHCKTRQTCTKCIECLSARAYQKPFWHYESRRPFPANGACPPCLALDADDIVAADGSTIKDVFKSLQSMPLHAAEKSYQPQAFIRPRPCVGYQSPFDYVFYFVNVASMDLSVILRAADLVLKHAGRANLVSSTLRNSSELQQAFFPAGVCSLLAPMISILHKPRTDLLSSHQRAHKEDLHDPS